MSLERNRWCACGSGRKLKNCCLDAYVAWQRQGKGLVAAYVDLGDGQRVPLEQYDGALDLDSPLIIELNPITAAWARNNIPPNADPSSETYRGMFLEHFADMTGGNISATLTAELDAYQRRQ